MPARINSRSDESRTLALRTESRGLSELSIETGDRSSPPRADYSLAGMSMSDVAVGIPEENCRPPKARDSKASTITSNPSFKLFPNVVGGYFDRLWEQATVVTDNSAEAVTHLDKRLAKRPDDTVETDLDETYMESVDLEQGERHVQAGPEAEDPLPKEVEETQLSEKRCIAERRNQVLLLMGLALFLLGLAVGLVIGSVTNK